MKTKTPSPTHSNETDIAVHTTAEMVVLGRHIHDYGFEPNEARIADIVAAGRRVAPDLVSLDVLADPAYPEIVRARALSRLTADWGPIEAELRRRRSEFEAALGDLLDGWNDHQQLKEEADDLDRLASARFRLDGLRDIVAEQRRRLSSSAA